MKHIPIIIAALVLVFFGTSVIFYTFYFINAQVLS